MFNLMSNCYTWISKIQEPIRKVKVLVVGLDRAGKTSCVRGMLRVPPGPDAGPTQGCVCTELRVENYLVTLLDAGGAPQWRGPWRERYGEVHGVVFVVDSSDRQRIREVRELLSELLKQPSVAGKPILVLANKQDKMNAMLGSELIEALCLERLVNQSRSLCHIEPCSALMDLRRWSDRRSLRGLRWLLRVVLLDYPELCARVAQDSARPRGRGEEDRCGRAEKGRSRTKGERSELRQVHQPKEREKKDKKAGSKLQPIRDILQKENSLQKKLKKKKKQVKIQEAEEEEGERGRGQEEEEGERGRGQEAEEEEGEGGEQEPPGGQKERASSTLMIPPKVKKVKKKRKAKQKEESLDESEPPADEDQASNAPGEEKKEKKKKKKKKTKVVKVTRKNKINTEEEPEGGHSQPVDLSATFDLYRKAIQALKQRQDHQGQ